jgi:hypothetical protein
MNPVVKFILRAILGAAGGLFLSRFFLRSDSVYTWLATSGLIIFLAYTLEHLRKRW